MTKTYKIEVDCAHCANLMEQAAAKISGVASVSIAFLPQKMTVEFTPEADPAATMQAVLKACRKVEPDCDIAL